MKAADLGAEMLAAYRAVGERERNHLAALGIDPEDIEMLIGVANVRIEGALFSPELDGRPAFVTPVRVQFPETPESTEPDSAVHLGDIVDLVAWHPAAPDRWALRAGAGEWLGACLPQYVEPRPVPIRRSIALWFRAGCTGLVPLSRDRADIYRLLSRCIGGIIAEDQAHAAELGGILERPWAAPPIFTPGVRRAA
jgi:hypothetical protein